MAPFLSCPHRTMRAAITILVLSPLALVRWVNGGPIKQRDVATCSEDYDIPTPTTSSTSVDARKLFRVRDDGSDDDNQNVLDIAALSCSTNIRKPCPDSSALSSDVCQAIGCCWSDSGDPLIPSCFYPMLIGGIPVNDPGASAPGGGGGEESPSPPQDNPGSPGDGASPSSTQYNPWSPGPTPPPPQESITPTPDQPQDTPSPSPPETSPSAPPSNGDPGLYIPPPETFIPLSTCQASIIQQMTNIYENSRVQFSYDYCENFNDGRGYTSGIVGFTTGTFDANIVVQRYVQLGGTDFNAFLATLASKGSSGSTDGLDGYCDTWRNAASNPLFRQAQDEIASSMYWSPALAKSNELGLKLPVSFGFMYDSWIQHGEGEKEGVLSMLSQVRTSPAVDEMAWLREFFNVRTTVLDTTSGWQGTSYRVRSYQYVADNSPNFGEGPIVILDNDGNPMNIECRLSLWGEYVPCYPNCG